MPLDNWCKLLNLSASGHTIHRKYHILILYDICNWTERILRHTTTLNGGSDVTDERLVLCLKLQIFIH